MAILYIEHVFAFGVALDMVHRNPQPEHVLFENRRLEATDPVQRSFTYPWTAVVEHNAEYRDYVQSELPPGR